MLFLQAGFGAAAPREDGPKAHGLRLLGRTPFCYFQRSTDSQESTPAITSEHLQHLYLLLPIKQYAEGPEEIRGRSGSRTRKVPNSYAEGPRFCTRKVPEVHGFCNTRCANLPIESMIRTYAEGPHSAGVGKFDRGGPTAYAEGPTGRNPSPLKDQCVRGRSI